MPRSPLELAKFHLNLKFLQIFKILTLDWPKLTDYSFIHFMCRLPTSIYKHTCKCAIKKIHKYFDTPEHVTRDACDHCSIAPHCMVICS